MLDLEGLLPRSEIMLRHSRELTRFQRNRIANKRKKKFKNLFYLSELIDELPNNWFSKHHFTDCKCRACRGSNYNRQKFDWKRAVVDQNYAALSKNDNQKTWW